MNLKLEKLRIAKVLRDAEKRSLEFLEPLECVKKAIHDFGDSLSVSCSFGKCSVAVLHMALQFKPDIKVVFCDTGVEYPETYDYMNLLAEKWHLNLIKTKPKKTFWECVKQYGFPQLRSKIKKPKCCIYLKEIPFAEICKQYGIKATLTGMRAGEAGNRMFWFSEAGQNYMVKKYALWKFNPIALWTFEDVEKYYVENNIPRNKLYEKVERSGCMPCTGFLNWEKQLARTNPKMYLYVQRLRGQTLLTECFNGA